MPMGFEADALRLRRAIRDLVAVSTVPAVWTGRRPRAIAAGLVDVLVNALYPTSFLCVCAIRRGCRGRNRTGSACTGSAWQAFPEWLQQYLSVNGRLSLITLLAFPAFQSRSRS
jgi:hypothetical protein